MSVPELISSTRSYTACIWYENLISIETLILGKWPDPVPVVVDLARLKRVAVAIET